MRASCVWKIIECASICLLAFSALGSRRALAAPEGGAGEGEPHGQPKNVIIMIADGAGYNHFLAGEYYRYDGDKTCPYFEGFLSFGVTTYPDSRSYDPGEAWRDFDYVNHGYTDSAAAATALATGYKTRNGVIGLDNDGKPIRNVVEYAEAAGKATGVVTTVQFSHATPAGFVAHNIARGNYAEIAREMILESAVDVIMGAGHPYYDDNGKALLIAEEGQQPWELSEKYCEYVGGKDAWKALVEGHAGADANDDGTPDPWTLIQTRQEFQALAENAQAGRVLGVAQVHKTLQQERHSLKGAEEDETPFESPLIETVPTLTEMSLGAIRVLAADPDGFFLMIEGGAVDWAGHDNQFGRMVEEMTAFLEAIEAVVAWVESESSWNETLLLITADHETGYLWGPGSGPDWKPIVDNGRGRMPGAEWHSEGHTNSLIPLYARGPGAERLNRTVRDIDPRRGPFVDNTDIGRLILECVNRQ